jgi:Flp pilus assembly protein TadG
MIGRSSTPLGAARERERGQVLVLFAFVLIALLLISALAVDYGGWLLARRSYQNIADEAALAGAYQLTNPTLAACPQGAGVSKQVCAREAAWAAIQNHIGLPSGATPFTLGATTAASLAVTWDSWKVWVASPPSEAGSAYTGLASSSKTVFVRVERTLSANLSRIVRPTETVGAWATAGRIPENFAIILLCGPTTTFSCTSANGDDLKVNGTGSSLVVQSGDIGSNSYLKTSGSGGYIALCEGNATLNQCSAYMHYADQCTVSTASCQLAGWNGSSIDTGTQYSGIALPQVIDPKYAPPTFSSTTVPWQCGGSGGISMAGPPVVDLNGSDVELAGAFVPPTLPPVSLGATRFKGTITDASFGGNLSGANVGVYTTATPPVLKYTATTPANGSYSIDVSPGTYNLQISKASYITQTYTFTINNNDQLTNDYALLGNPGTLTGTVKTSGNVAVSGATVAVSGGTQTTTDASGNYTITNVAAGVRSVSASAVGYVSSTASVTMPAGGPATQNFILGPSGTITGTITDSVTSAPISGATVQIAGVGTTTTLADGTYALSNIPPATYTVSASATGYLSANRTNVVVTAGATTSNINFALVPNTGTITGTVRDATTGLAIPGVTVTATGASTGVGTTNASGVYTITPLTPGNGYTVSTSLSGYEPASQGGVTVTAGGTTTVNFTNANALWPSRCGTGGRRGNWACGYGTGGCPSVTNPTGSNVSCSSFDATNVIRPGTYQDIDVGTSTAAGCAWIDPLGSPTGLLAGQLPGVVHITGTLTIWGDSFLFGDGVTVFLDPGASVVVKNSGGFVFNYQDGSNTYTNGQSSYCTAHTGQCAWRTASKIGGTGVTFCSGDSTDGLADLRKGAWTTKTRSTWDTSTTPYCFNDADYGAGATTYNGEIGMAWYLRDTPPCSNRKCRFDLSGQMGFIFDGVLYGPNDAIGLGGQGAQAAAGQIVAFTLTFSGTTTIYQRYSGIEVEGAPYLIEPYVGE